MKRKKVYRLFTAIIVIVFMCCIVRQTRTNVLAAHLDYLYGRVLAVSEKCMYVRVFAESNNVRRGEKVRVMLEQNNVEDWEKGDRVKLSYLTRVPGTKHGIKELDMENTLISGDDNEVWIQSIRDQIEWSEGES